MYVVTFYSYKGGVGRTMTLMNVAAELAKRGRKIMVIDFDLEAPGLTTYGFCNSAAKKRGIVDYVCEYSNTLVAPDVRDFTSECELKDKDDNSYNLLVMSAGRQDEKYRENFYSINWENLYSDRSGYLMMEDLKAQWEEFYKPDYVFIDSRTGLTDISGICTRQLPDAVVITFFPNRQNLSGLERIVHEIRQEKEGSRKKEIALHFVSSNTPSADDEDGILKRNLNEFQSKLQYTEGTIINYYNDLSIVDQLIFTLDKPKTSLAAQYRKLTNTIIERNPDDREGVLNRLAKIDANRNTITYEDIKEARELISILRPKYQSDAEVLKSLGDVALHKLVGDADAIDLYKESIACGTKTPEIFRNLASAYDKIDADSEAIDAFKQLLRLTDVEVVDIYFALRRVTEIDESEIQNINSIPSLVRLGYAEGLFLIDHLLRTRRKLLPLALQMANILIESTTLEEKFKKVVISTKSQLLIAMGNFEEAIDLMDDRETVLEKGPIYKTFNRAMAEWGQFGTIPRDLIERVVFFDTINSDNQDANYAQCLALSNWAIGDIESAHKWLELAHQRVAEDPKIPITDSVFSCWRYLNVTKRDFLKDLESIESLLDGDKILPEFIKQRTS